MVKLLSAIAYDHRAWEEQGVAHPSIAVQGELPATAQPFSVVRVYQGAQGVYEEALLLLDPDDVVVWERPYRLVALRGEMYQDRFEALVRDPIRIEQFGDHALVLLVGGNEVGRIPVFIDAPQSLRSTGALGDAVNAALKKGAIVWLAIPQADGSSVHRPAWYVLDGGKIYVLTGPGEQDLTGIERADKVELHVPSAEVHATIGVVPATVRTVPHDEDTYERIAKIGLRTRLNLPDGEAALERWHQTCTLVELSPQL